MLAHLLLLLLLAHLLLLLLLAHLLLLLLLAHLLLLLASGFFLLLAHLGFLEGLCVGGSLLFGGAGLRLALGFLLCCLHLLLAFLLINNGEGLSLGLLLLLHLSLLCGLALCGDLFSGGHFGSALDSILCGFGLSLGGCCVLCGFVHRCLFLSLLFSLILLLSVLAGFSEARARVFCIGACLLLRLLAIAQRAAHARGIAWLLFVLLIGRSQFFWGQRVSTWELRCSCRFLRGGWICGSMRGFVLVEWRYDSMAG